MKKYDFNNNRTFKKLFKDLYYKRVTTNDVRNKQEEFNVVLDLLEKYNPKHDKYVTLKNNLVDNASKFYKGKEKIIEGFKNGLFPFYDKEYEKRMKYEEKQDEEQEKQEE